VRRWLAALAAAAFVPGLPGCSVLPSQPAPLVATLVAPSVFAVLGGEVGNAGFIVGSSGSILIETGSSYRHAEQLIETAERVGGQPVVLAIITQPLQEFVMGGAAFKRRGIPVLAQKAGAALIGQRCGHCLDNLTRLLGAERMQGTTVEVPGRTVDASGRLQVAGRSLQLLHFGWAQTPGDLAVIDEASGVVFTGALVSIGRVPDLRDANPEGWQQALVQLKQWPMTRLVPGYGPIGTARDIEPVSRYLSDLQTRVDALLQSDASLSEAITKGDLPQYAPWSAYAELHRRNVQQVYLQREAEAFRQ
jgi:glyoxylase-like metal-dependent hydrolase (beta-lactamase superfamily II)